MLQAALADCQSLDLLPFTQDGFVAPEVDVGGCDENGGAKLGHGSAAVLAVRAA